MDGMRISNKRRRAYPVTQGEQLAAIAAQIPDREALDTALFGLSDTARAAMIAGLLPYLKFDPTATE